MSEHPQFTLPRELLQDLNPPPPPPVLDVELPDVPPPQFSVAFPKRFSASELKVVARAITPSSKSRTEKSNVPTEEEVVMFNTTVNPLAQADDATAQVYTTMTELRSSILSERKLLLIVDLREDQMCGTICGSMHIPYSVFDQRVGEVMFELKRRSERGTSSVVVVDRAVRTKASLEVVFKISSLLVAHELKANVSVLEGGLEACFGNLSYVLDERITQDVDVANWMGDIDEGSDIE